MVRRDMEKLVHKSKIFVRKYQKAANPFAFITAWLYYMPGNAVCGPKRWIMYKIFTKSDHLPSFYPLTLVHACLMPVTELHSHDCVEIGIAVQGRALHVCGGFRREFLPGDVIVIPASVEHSFPETENFTMYNILFHPRDLNIPQQDLIKFPGFQEIFNPEIPPEDVPVCSFHLQDDDFRSIRKTLALMRGEQQEIGRSGYRSAMMGLFMHLLCHLLRSYSSENARDTPANYEQNVDRAIGYLHKHYLEPFDLNHLLKVSAMSRCNFIKRFHLITGLTPKQFVLRKKIAHAAKMIAETELSFSEIAMRCGFCDSSHFSKRFRQITGESPRNYRIRITEQSDREYDVSRRYIENPFFRIPERKR